VAAERGTEVGRTGSEDEIDTVAGTSLTGGGERRWNRARSAATGVHHPLHGVRALRSWVVTGGGAAADGGGGATGARRRSRDRWRRSSDRWRRRRIDVWRSSDRRRRTARGGAAIKGFIREEMLLEARWTIECTVVGPDVEWRPFYGIWIVLEMV
jgi:hypothetical protein